MMCRIYVFLVIFVVTMLQGCAGTLGAYRAAEGLYETSFVIGEHYFATVREINALAAAGTLTQHETAQLAEIALQTRPAVLSMLSIARDYQATRSAETEAELSEAIASAAISVSGLYDAFQAFQGTSSNPLPWHQCLDFPVPALQRCVITVT